MGANPAQQLERRKRLQKVDALMMNGFGARAIHDLIGEAEGVTYGTIRNDIAAINKARREELDALTELNGRADWLARLHAVRRAAVTEKDLRLVHKIDIQIARIQGVSVDPKQTVDLSITGAREFMENIMGIIFSIVTDAATQDRIIEAIRDASGPLDPGKRLIGG